MISINIYYYYYYIRGGYLKTLRYQYTTDLNVRIMGTNVGPFMNVCEYCG